MCSVVCVSMEPAVAISVAQANRDTCAGSGFPATHPIISIPALHATEVHHIVLIQYYPPTSSVLFLPNPF